VLGWTAAEDCPSELLLAHLVEYGGEMSVVEDSRMRFRLLV
jgi:hypothetical protein